MGHPFQMLCNYYPAADNGVMLQGDIMQAMTLIEIEVDRKRIESIRDISIPIVGDVISIGQLNIVIEVKRRHWVFDKDQSHRHRELRCVLECEKVT